MRLRIAQQAHNDLDEIWIYIAQESSNAASATRVVEAIAGTFRLLAQYPLIGKSLQSAQRPQIRTFVASRYLIFYRPKGDELRIIHASRDAFAVFAED